MKMEADNINQLYHDILVRILDKGKEVNGTLELTNTQFTLTNLDNNVITIREKMSFKYLLGELIWYFSGSNDVDFIGKFSSFWENISDDGKTSNSAYGYILQNKFDFNQVEQIVEILTEDKGSRRALMNINTPHNQVIETKDEPCTIALQYYIRDGKLHSTGMMRSNDMWFGFPYDIPYFTELQKYIADRLGVEVGTYTHFVTSMHIYERNLEDIEQTVVNYGKLDQKEFKINFKQLVDNVDELYELLDNSDDASDNVLKLCNEYGVLE